MADGGGDTAKRHQHLSPTGDSLHHRRRQQLPFLPHELIFDILLWLPVRSLLQFKRVCKSWQTIISDHQFAKKHIRNLTLNPNITHQRLFCFRYHFQTYKIASFPLKPLFENPLEPIESVEFTIKKKFRMIGSCNGLLCLFDMDHGYVKLWNPSIGFESKNSPTLDFYDNYAVIKYYGFGYDHVNDKYKVLLSRPCTCDGKYEIVTQIYTFGENCWTTIQNFPCFSIRPVGKFVSGTLNWLVVKKDISSKHGVILSFDLEKETYKELLLPENVDVQDWNHVLGILSNCLCACFGPDKTHRSLWVMKKYGVAESWNRLILIPYEQLSNRLQHRLRFTNPFFILENGIVLLSKLDECLLGSRFDGFEQHIYYPSLVSPQL